MIGNAGRGGLPGGNERLYVRFRVSSTVGETTFEVGVHTWYQTPLIAFLVADPLRNPRVSGRPTATTGFLGMSRRNPGRLGDMIKSRSKRIKGRMRQDPHRSTSPAPGTIDGKGGVQRSLFGSKAFAKHSHLLPTLTLDRERHGGGNKV